MREKTIGGEDSKYRCVVKVSFHKTCIYLKGICNGENKTTTLVLLGPRGGGGGSKKAVPADTVDALRGGRKGDTFNIKL